MHWSTITNYALNSFSLILTCFILIIAYTIKMHRRFLSEIMTYIFFSEIINSLSKYLSFLWNSCNYSNPRYSRKICTRIKTPGNIQIYLHIFADMLSMASSVVISFLSYDSLKNRPRRLVNNNSARTATRVILFTFATVCSITLGTVQIFVYQFYPERDRVYVNRGQCTPMSCAIAPDLSLILIGIVFGSSISTIFISCINWKALRMHLKRVSSSEKNDNQALLVKIKMAQWRIMLFPILSSLLFIVYYFDEFLKDIYREEFYEMRTLMDITGNFYNIGNGIRGCVFCLLITFTIPDLWKAIIGKFKCKNEGNEEEIMRRKSFE